MPEHHNKTTSTSEGIVLCVNDFQKAQTEIERLTNRTEGDAQEIAMQTVVSILKEVKNDGDKAIVKYTEKFDGFKPNPLHITQETLKSAWDSTPEKLKKALQLAHQRIKDFHSQQIPKDLSIKGIHGENLGRRWRPVKRAGIYIPGGRASYPSTVLMNVIPAQVAGVEEILMVSPAGKNGQINKTVLGAAHLAGIKDVLRIGGAQAIGALAYGTKTIKKVDVITGPGNLYVTLAKKSVFGQVGIDSLAGPSEVLIIADHTARPEQVAADLLAQAEHDPLAASVLLTTDKNLSNVINDHLSIQLQSHPRAKICLDSLRNWGLIVLCKDIQACLKLSDEFAPEHLELLVENPHDLIKQVKNAGAIFLGPWTPEAVGDYLAGPNHTLPTSGTAKFSGALGVETFMKNTSLIEFTRKAFESTSEAVKELAKSEGLHSHAESVRIREKIKPFNYEPNDEHRQLHQ